MIHMVSTRNSVGRPRDASVDVSILAATRDLLVEQGFDLMSLESVAARAGVGKGAIYRRWPDKTRLVVAAVGDLAPVPQLPDTGTLRGDLLACARLFEQNAHTQAVLAGLMTAMGRSPELREAGRDALGAPFTALFQHVIERWITSGSVSDAIDVQAVSELFPALAFHRLTAIGLNVDEAFVIRTIDHIVLKVLDSTDPTPSD